MITLPLLETESLSLSLSLSLSSIPKYIGLDNYVESIDPTFRGAGGVD